MPLRPQAALLAAAVLLGCGSSGSSGASTSASSSGSTCGTCPTGFTCSAGSCVETSTAGTSSSTAVCYASVASSGAAAADVLHLGTFGVGSTASFTVPSGVAGLTIVQQAVSGAVASIDASGATYDDVAVPLRVTAPGGEVWYDDLAGAPADGSGDLGFFASDAPGVGALAFPGTSAALARVAAGGLPAGAWSLVVSDYAYECATQTSGCTGGTTAAVYDVTVVLRRGTAAGAVPASGVLDVTFTFATTEAPDESGKTTSPLTASAAPSDADLARMVSSLRSDLARAGLTLGTVSWRDLSSDVQATYAAGVDLDGTGTCAGLPQLLKQATSSTALEVFFVAALTSGSTATGYEIVGVDGTVPGPATFPGTLASGVAVSSADLRYGHSACTGAPSVSCGADEIAFVVAHEAGHFLGLYHTTEADGLAFDPLSDTVTCPCASCRSGGAVCGTSASAHVMTSAECAGTTARCGGGTNLMFWTMSDGGEGALTAEQGAVMRASPLVR